MTMLADGTSSAFLTPPISGCKGSADAKGKVLLAGTQALRAPGAVAAMADPTIGGLCGA